VLVASGGEHNHELSVILWTKLPLLANNTVASAQFYRTLIFEPFSWTTPTHPAAGSDRWLLMSLRSSRPHALNAMSLRGFLLSPFNILTEHRYPGGVRLRFVLGATIGCGFEVRAAVAFANLAWRIRENGG
jgi:hypothetical protein